MASQMTVASATEKTLSQKLWKMRWRTGYLPRASAVVEPESSPGLGSDSGGAVGAGFTAVALWRRLTSLLGLPGLTRAEVRNDRSCSALTPRVSWPRKE